MRSATADGRQGARRGRCRPAPTTASMPHVWDIAAARSATRERRGSDTPIWLVGARGRAGSRSASPLVGLRHRRRSSASAWRSLMQRFRARRARPAALRRSCRQTVPLIALAPLVVGLGRPALAVRAGDWQPWMSVAVIAAYLAFFPVAVGALRGLQSPPPDVGRADGLLRRRAGGRRCVKLRFPAAVPYLVPALKLARGRGGRRRRRGRDLDRHRGGIGRLIIEYSREAHRPTRPRCTRPSSAPPSSAWWWPASSPSSTSRSCATARRRHGMTTTRVDARPSRSPAVVGKVFNRGPAEPGRRARATSTSTVDAGRVRVADRAVGLRQEHAAAAHRQPHRADARAR